MSDTINYIAITEFRERGYLQELNRRFLHPLGLAMEVVIDDGTERLGGVWDYRDDPEGMSYGDITDEMRINATAVESEWAEKERTRNDRLGYMVQPT